MFLVRPCTPYTHHSYRPCGARTPSRREKKERRGCTSLFLFSPQPSLPPPSLFLSYSHRHLPQTLSVLLLSIQASPFLSYRPPSTTTSSPFTLYFSTGPRPSAFPSFPPLSSLLSLHRCLSPCSFSLLSPSPLSALFCLHFPPWFSRSFLSLYLSFTP